MTDKVTSDSESGASQASQLRRWWDRPTIRELKRRARGAVFASNEDYARMRLPDGESVHLGGVVLTEIFTPSTLSNLVATLKKWPTKDEQARQTWLHHLAKCRAGEHRGSTSLGVIRQPGKILVQGDYDPDLPDGVEGVWLYMEYMLPSIVAVVATFTFAEDGGDLSPILATDYPPHISKTHVHVFGRFGLLRARLPWARPARAFGGSTISFPDSVKRQACEDAIYKLQRQCRAWFIRKFKGRFAPAPITRQPTIRLMFTRTQKPFAADEAAEFLGSVGLHRGFDVYREPSENGWLLNIGTFPVDERYIPVTMAARRKDLANLDESSDDDGIWVQTQRFGMSDASLATRLALMNLLGLFAEDLAHLRDKQAVQGRFRNPVRNARRLDEYLIGDGLDDATVARDLESFTQDVHHFNHFVPRYVLEEPELPVKDQATEPLQLLDNLRESLHQNVARFVGDVERTTANIRASAELRQAVANTRLQRIVIVVALTALIVALGRI